MKFMVEWQMHEGELHDTLATFSQMTTEQDSELMGNELTLIGRWHDVVGARGVAIFETDNAEAISAYSLVWNTYMDLEITPVIDDDEAKRLGAGLVEEAPEEE